MLVVTHGGPRPLSPSPASLCVLLSPALWEASVDRRNKDATLCSFRKPVGESDRDGGRRRSPQAPDPGPVAKGAAVIRDHRLERVTFKP